MKKVIKIVTSVVGFLLLILFTQSFNLSGPQPAPAPSGTVISITNADALDGAGEWVWEDRYGFYALDNFYYQDGHADIYSRESSSDSWIFQGDMLMSSSTCTMSGSKVLVFTVNVNYLSNP